MPLYDFKCGECGATFEVKASIQQKIAGLAPQCPTCGAGNAQQVITAGLFVRSGDNTGSSGSCCGPDAKPGCCR